ncbi:nicotinamide N-methyltransferase-like [Ixodes scapularis]|uniref:nicotinamide N-methyltransferase-like n=1 Tax=Ixodes scapularis TaxID=6945 RepID=UPI001A9F7F02|nr:nicotinamide N-methyltransferase-like [Ixodes scapularis]
MGSRPVSAVEITTSRAASNMMALREMLKVTTATLKLGSRRLKNISSKTRSYSSKTSLTMESQTLRAAYKEQFLPRTYMDVYGRLTGEAITSMAENLHRIFQSDLAQGGSLLDVGTGPTLLTSLLASSRFNDIVLSDLVEANRLELQKWLNKDEDAIDWTFRAEEVAAIEECSDVKKGALEILERTRKAIRKVVPCDVLEPRVLPEEHREAFDVVLSVGCLDSAAADHESFRSAVRNVGTLAKQGGLLIIVGAGGVKSYPLGTADITHANLTENVLKEAVICAGFEMKQYQYKILGLVVGSPDTFRFCLAARKT